MNSVTLSRQPPVPTAVVAVAVGDGVVSILKSMGVHAVVTGGQSMNPSTADLVQAVESVPAPEVVILPNNKNIIPVAEQVDAQTSRTVRVVPTRGIAEGIASLMSYDPQSTAEANADSMTEVASGVLAGEVTQAVRESTSDAGPIATGDWLGIRREGICAVQSTMAEAAIELLNVMITRDHELLTVIAGEDADDDTTARIESWVEEHHGDVEVEVHEAANRSTPTTSGSSSPLGGHGVPEGDPPLTLRDLDQIPVSRLRGVGDKKDAALAGSEIRTVLDLLTHYPRRHLDRTREASIGDLQPGEEATVVGEVRSSRTRQLRGRRTLTEVVIGDGGHQLRLTFFNQRWREKQLTPA